MLYSEQEIDAAIRLISGGRVLDVATGMGSMIEWMARALKDYREIIGIDVIPLKDRPGLPSPSIFERENVRFMTMDAHDLDFEDASFDTVTISTSLHHLADPRRVLDEMMRVLKPGGHLILYEMYRDNQTETQLTHVYIHHFWSAVDTAMGVCHHETFTRQQLVDLVETLGLRTVKYYDYADLTEDPHKPETIETLHERLARTLERAQTLPSFADLQARGAEIGRRLDEVGLHWATSLVVIGEK